ncbi:MAG: hypothetical protein KA116_05155 [Proteobacteria bacterium]|nr:hypothetical protein [Pseudomonadota bacterium]
MKNYIRSLVVISFVSTFNIELRADDVADEKISPAVEEKLNDLLPPGKFEMYKSPHGTNPFLKYRETAEKYLENRTPEEFADYLMNKLNSCKPSYIANEIYQFSIISNNANKRNLKQPQIKESRDIENEVIAELNKKTSKSAKDADESNGKAQDSAFWKQSKIPQDLTK